MPKTYFNDVGFLRCLESDSNQRLERFKQALIEKIENGSTSTAIQTDGKYFEQIIAQEIKAKGFKFAYLYSNIDRNEIEFIISPSHYNVALEIKSGGFDDFKSLKNYVCASKKGLLASMYPYLGEYSSNLAFVPIYDICFISQDDLCTHDFNSLDDKTIQVIDSGRLPRTPGFFNQ